MLHRDIRGSTAGFPALETNLAMSMGPSDGVLGETLDVLGSVMFFDRNAEVFADEEPAEYVYKVISGVVRTCKFLEDGRRQIGAFHFSGDIFGFEPFTIHSFSAEAVTPCKLLVVKRSALTTAAGKDGALGSALWMVATREVQRLQEHMVLLGRKCASERVMTFLCGTAARLNSGALVEIPMSRQDIADHLGLTIETVSRTITQLQESGEIALESSRRIRMNERRFAA